MERKVKILIVDDELPVCRSISRVLEPEGYAVDTALSGKEALSKEEENRYDMMLVDLMMPGMSGMDLIKSVKEKRPDMVMIMITGYPTMKTAVESVKLGAFDYIPKPFTPEELRSLVLRALERKRLHEKEMAPKEGLAAEERAKPPVSKDRYCIPDHCWAKVEDDGSVRIGVHEIFLMTIKSISSIDFPYEDEKIGQGDACLWFVDANGNLHRMWAPVSGRVIQVNEELKGNYSQVMRDPYGSGWLLLIQPTKLEDDLKNLAPLEHE
jgi:CheY-like chemotaxis protein/glycine cleavage system H lipoate-binding protein